MTYRFAANDRRSSNYHGGATGSYSVTTSSDPRKASDDVVYVNINVYNSNGTHSIPMELPPVTRTQPIINRASDYYCSVVRFEVPKINIPYFMFPNSTPFFADKQFYITFSDGVTDTQVQLAYVPSGILPVDGSLPIYFVGQFLQSVNNAFAAANAQAIIDGVAGVTANPPIARIRDDGKLEILVDVNATFQLFFNWNLYRYFNGIFGYFNGYSATGDKDEQIYYLPANTGIQTLVNRVTIGAVTYWFVKQDYPGFYLWDGTAQIAMTTSTLPILSEYTQGIDASGNNVTLNSLTDFIPVKDLGVANNSPFLYFANEYRLIDMKGQDPITKIDIKFYDVDSFGVIRPMVLSPFGSFSVKLMFVKKSLYDNEYGGNAGMPLPILGV